MNICKKNIEIFQYFGKFKYVFLTEPPITKLATRRKSVFAETYNPEEDEEDEGLKVRFIFFNFTHFMSFNYFFFNSLYVSYVLLIILYKELYYR